MRTGSLRRSTRGRWARCAATACAVSAAALAAHASSVRVEIEVHPTTLALGESARGRLVVLDGSRVSEPVWEDGAGLDIVTTGRETSHSLVNGQRQSERVFHFEVIARKEGAHRVAPRDFTVNGRSVPVEPVHLRVVAAREDDDREPANVFARIEIERERLFLQESFPAVLALYYWDVEVDTQVQLEGLTTAGIEWGRFQEMAGTRARVGDRLYHVRRFRTRARGLSAGTFHLAPTLVIQERVRETPAGGRPSGRPWPRGFDDFFGGGVQRRTRRVAVRPVDIEIQPLPEADRPAGFNGAVGRFSFDVEVDRNETAVGEPVALRMTLRGEGNPDLVHAPEMAAGERFRPYETRLVGRDYDAERGVGMKVFETVLVPRVPDLVEIPAVSFSFFDPVDARYRTLVRGPFPLAVRPAPNGTGAAAVIHAEPRRTNGADADGPTPGLRYLKPAPRRWDPGPVATALDADRFRPVTDLAPLLLAAALGWAGRRRSRFERDPARARRARAPRSARRDLRSAEQAACAGQAAAFYERLGAALGRYFGHRLNLPPGEVTADRVIEAGVRAGLRPEAADRLHEVMECVDRSRFGGNSGSSREDMLTLLNHVRATLRESERIPW